MNGQVQRVLQDSVYKMIRDKHPDIWHSLCPRVYRDTEKWCSPLIPAFHMSAACMGYAIGAAMNYYDRISLTVASLVSSLKVPTLHVASELLEAVGSSSPPDTIKWSDVPFPHKAGVLLLPTGAIRLDNGHQLNWISWAIASHNQPLKIPGSWGKVVDFKIEDGGEGIMFCTGKYPDVSDQYDCESFSTSFSMDHCPQLRDALGDDVEDDLSLDESEAFKRLTTIAVKIFFAISARPNLLEMTGEKLNTMKKGPAREEWTPNWIGRTYRIQRADGDGTHASPRLHWRRGHFRQQPCGAGGKERKTIWLEPVLVGE